MIPIPHLRNYSKNTFVYEARASSNGHLFLYRISVQYCSELPDGRPTAMPGGGIRGQPSPSFQETLGSPTSGKGSPEIPQIATTLHQSHENKSFLGGDEIDEGVP